MRCILQFGFAVETATLREIDLRTERGICNLAGLTKISDL